MFHMRCDTCTASCEFCTHIWLYVCSWIVSAKNVLALRGYDSSIKTESARAGSQSLLPWDTLKEATGDATAQRAATWLPQKSWHTTQSWSSGDRTEGLLIGDTSDDAFFVSALISDVSQKAETWKNQHSANILLGLQYFWPHPALQIAHPQACHTSLGLTAFHDGRPEHAAVLLLGNSKEFCSLIRFARILRKKIPDLLGGFAQMRLWDDEVWIWCRSINPSGATDQNLPVSFREVAWLSSPRATGVRPGLVTMMKAPSLRIENLRIPYPTWLIFAILEGGWEYHLWVRLSFCGWLYEALSDV